MKQIEISASTFDRLAQHASGFETPENVIIRLLDIAEAEPGKKPVLTFDPADEEVFKRQLLQTRRANVHLRMADGSVEQGTWNVRALNENSNLRANLWSGYLRGWQEKKIVAATFSIADDEASDEPLSVLSTVNYNDYVINRVEGGAIQVLKDGLNISPVYPVLRKIAKETGIALTNSNGNDMNTRQLGDKIIKAINK